MGIWMINNGIWGTKIQAANHGHIYMSIRCMCIGVDS